MIEEGVNIELRKHANRTYNQWEVEVIHTKKGEIEELHNRFLPSRRDAVNYINKKLTDMADL